MLGPRFFEPACTVFWEETNDPREIKLIGELKFYIVNSEADAAHEVLSRYEAEMLRKEVVRQKSSAKTLKEKMLAEMYQDLSGIPPATFGVSNF